MKNKIHKIQYRKQKTKENKKEQNTKHAIIKTHKSGNKTHNTKRKTKDIEQETQNVKTEDKTDNKI